MTLFNESIKEGQRVQEPTVAISMTDLITLMAKQVADQVVGELREKDISPILTRISAIEIRQAQPNNDVQQQKSSVEHIKGMFDGAWKLGIIALAILEAYHYLKN